MQSIESTFIQQVSQLTDFSLLCFLTDADLLL